MSGNWHEGGVESQAGRIALGALLIAVGAGFLASQLFNVDLGRYGWPGFVIVPGVLMLGVGLAIPREAGLGLAVPGSIVTVVGLVLAFQEATGAWASWAYAWALVAPGSVGIALVLYGILHRHPDLVDAGARTAAVGLGLFVGFGLFFENVLGLDNGQSVTPLQNLFPVLSVVLGVIIVLLNLLPHGRTPADKANGSD